MNRGLELSAGEYTLLTEDDIVLDPDCLRRLVEYMEADPETGIAGPVIYNKSEGTIRCAAGDFELGGVYRIQIHGAGERDEGQFPRPFQVTYIDGAVMFARTEFWRRLGGFREEFFMYGESVELCAKAAKTGKALTLVPQAKVYHFEPPPGANSSPEFFFHRHKNFFALYLLHARARYLPEFFARYAGLGLLRAAGQREPAPLPARARLDGAPRAVAAAREDERPALSLLPRRAASPTPKGSPLTMSSENVMPASRPGESLRVVARALAPRGVHALYLRLKMLRHARRLVALREASEDPRVWIDELLGSYFFRPLQKRSEVLRLTELVRELRPAAVCEIGAAGGGTAFLFAHAAAEDATIVSVDLEFEAARREAVRLFARARQRLVCVQGDSHEGGHVARRPRGARGPTRSTCSTSTATTASRASQPTSGSTRRSCAPGGLVVLHDIVPDFRTRYGVETSSDTGGVPRFWQQVKRAGARGHGDRRGRGAGRLRHRHPEVAGGRAGVGLR